MACFAGNIELPAQHRHFLAFQQPGYESESFVHLGTLLPRHLRLPQMPESVTYVSGMLCNLCARKHNRYPPSPLTHLGVAPPENCQFPPSDGGVCLVSLAI